ncbi:MAG: hypothetical protein EPN79_11040 [Burkholderiaceae bacterium]|nr:MAG: hypothetical protein EPN79_11040 [Burkholderiaceae bacterium]TBR76781.1 MAG: hypothetical protein EPN64_06035 [Burkholderiaceae bacterium]
MATQTIQRPASSTSTPAHSAADQVSRLTRLVTLLGASIIILVIGLCIAIVFVVKDHHEVIAVTDDGRVVPVIPLDTPYVSDARVLGYVDECARKIFNHDFVHWRTTLQESKTCFTQRGGDAVEQALAPWISDIVARELTMSVSIADTPVIVKRGIFDGSFAWRVQAPISLFRRGTRVSDVPRPFMLEVVVRRVSLDENPRGIAIDSLQLVPDTTRGG